MGTFKLSSSYELRVLEDTETVLYETFLTNKVMVDLKTSQASMVGVKVSSSRCPHGLGFTTLRVKS